MKDFIKIVRPVLASVSINGLKRDYKVEPKHRRLLYSIAINQIEGVLTEDMFDFWMISGNAINTMYRRTVKGRDGIG